MSSPALSLVNVGYAALVSWFLYLIAGGIYRLYFHPLAKFPGPKLAALTRWYEFYHDVVHRGCFIWKLQELHDRYGSISSYRSDPKPTRLSLTSLSSPQARLSGSHLMNSTLETQTITKNCTRQRPKNETSMKDG